MKWFLRFRSSSIANSWAFIIIVFLTISISLINLIWLIHEVSYFRKESKKLRDNYIEQQKESLKENVKKNPNQWPKQLTGETFCNDHAEVIGQLIFDAARKIARAYCDTNEPERSRLRVKGIDVSPADVKPLRKKGKKRVKRAKR